MDIQGHPVFFGNNSLAVVSGLRVLNIDPDRPAKRALTLNDIANSSRRKVTSAYYKTKTIIVTVDITRPTRALLERSIDDLNSILHPVEANLVFDQSGMKRVYLATFNSIEPVERGGSYAKFDIVFECSIAFGYDESFTLLLSDTASTSAYRNDQFTVQGSADFQMPYITVTFTAVSGAENRSVVFENEATGQQLEIRRTWEAGDVLVVDGINNTITVNDEAVENTGKIPEFTKGTNWLVYSDQFDSRTMNYQVKYKRRWV